jgi:hypothetical protein
MMNYKNKWHSIWLWPTPNWMGTSTHISFKWEEFNVDMEVSLVLPSDISHYLPDHQILIKDKHLRVGWGEIEMNWWEPNLGLNEGLLQPTAVPAHAHGRYTGFLHRFCPLFLPLGNVIVSAFLCVGWMKRRLRQQNLQAIALLWGVKKRRGRGNDLTSVPKRPKGYQPWK